MQRRKNRLQSNQSRYKYGFYDINKCFVSENSHLRSTQTRCHCACLPVLLFLWFWLVFSLSPSSTKICDWISFKFYVQPSQAFGHFTFDSFSMVKILRAHGANTHNRISKWYFATVDDVYQPAVNRVAEWPVNPTLFNIFWKHSKHKQCQFVDDKNGREVRDSILDTVRVFTALVVLCCHLFNVFGRCFVGGVAVGWSSFAFLLFIYASAFYGLLPQ